MNDRISFDIVQYIIGENSFILKQFVCGSRRIYALSNIERLFRIIHNLNSRKMYQLKNQKKKNELIIQWT